MHSSNLPSLPPLHTTTTILRAEGSGPQRRPHPPCPRTPGPRTPGGEWDEEDDERGGAEGGVAVEQACVEEERTA